VVRSLPSPAIVCAVTNGGALYDYRLPADKIGLIVDRGNDWGELGEVQQVLDAFGDAMWIYRDQDRATTRALNLYTGQHRGALPSPFQ
jgi:hypothetical protein